METEKTVPMAEDPGGGLSAAVAATKDTSGDKFKRKIACMACRTNKMRCHLAHPEAGQLDPCQRCVKMKLECNYRPKRKPVKVEKPPPPVEPAQHIGSSTSPSFQPTISSPQTAAHKLQLPFPSELEHSQTLTFKPPIGSTLTPKRRSTSFSRNRVESGSRSRFRSRSRSRSRSDSPSSSDYVNVDNSERSKLHESTAESGRADFGSTSLNPRNHYTGFAQRYNDPYTMSNGYPLPSQALFTPEIGHSQLSDQRVIDIQDVRRRRIPEASRRFEPFSETGSMNTPRSFHEHEQGRGESHPETNWFSNEGHDYGDRSRQYGEYERAGRGDVRSSRIADARVSIERQRVSSMRNQNEYGTRMGRGMDTDVNTNTDLGSRSDHRHPYENRSSIYDDMDVRPIDSARLNTMGHALESHSSGYQAIHESPGNVSLTLRSLSNRNLSTSDPTLAYTKSPHFSENSSLFMPSDNDSSSATHIPPLRRSVTAFSLAPDELAAISHRGTGYRINGLGGSPALHSRSLSHTMDEIVKPRYTESHRQLSDLSSGISPLVPVVNLADSFPPLGPRKEHGQTTKNEQASGYTEMGSSVADLSNTGTRLPMALASILDLMRKEVSSPPSSQTDKEVAIDEHTDEFSREHENGKKRVRQVHDDQRSYASSPESDRPPDKKSRYVEPGSAGPLDETQRSAPVVDRYVLPPTRPSRTQGFGQETKRRSEWDDPVALGLIDAVNVPYLFTTFFQNHNTYIALLDPALHTPEYTFATSPILFTAIITVTANAFLPTRYPELLKHMNFMLGKAFEHTDVEIGLCQALSLLSVWKEGGDRGSWLRTGYAIRIAYELGLDAPSERPLPDDELKAREELNKERTWWQLVQFDRTTFYMHGYRPRMVQPETIRDIQAWAVDHGDYPCYSDAMLAASHASGNSMSSLATASLRKNGTDVATHKSLVDRLTFDAKKWSRKWLADDPPIPLHPTSRIFVRFYLLSNNFEISEFRRIGAHGNDSVDEQRGDDDTEPFVESVTAALGMLKLIYEEMVPAGVLKFGPDILTIRAAKCGVFLARNVTRIPASLRQEIQLIFAQLIRSCKAAFSQPGDTAYHQAKFFSSLLRVSSVVNTPRKVGSPASGERNGIVQSGMASGNNEEEFDGDELANRLQERLPLIKGKETGDPASSVSNLDEGITVSNEEIVERTSRSVGMTPGALPQDGDSTALTYNDVFSDDLFQGLDMFPFDDGKSIETILQESYDWLNLDPSVFNQAGPYGFGQPFN